MSERLGEALLDLDTNDKGFRKGIDRAERDATGLGRTLDGISRKAIAMGKGLMVGAGVGVAAMGVLVKRSIDLADEMSKSALRAGVTTEELSRLAWAGELSDVSLGALTTSVARLNNVLSEVASGGAKDTKAIFDAIGVSVTEADGSLRNSNDVFYDLADVFAGMENGAERTALAIQIFGRSGADLIPLLVNGSAGLRKMADEADHLGKTISTQAGRDAEQFNDTLTRIGAVVDGVGLKVATGLLPRLQSLATTLADPDFATAAQGMATAVVTAIDAIIQIVVGASNALRDFLNLLNTATSGGSLTNQAVLLDNDELAKQIARAEEILANPNANSVARERSSAWLRSLIAQRDQRTNMDHVGAGASWSDLQSLLGAPASSGSAAPDFSGLFKDIGSSAAAAEDKVATLLNSLRAERDVLRETDPVQQRLISMRSDLAAATDAQRAEVENLIRTIHEETQAWENSQAAAQMFGDFALDALEGLRKETKSVTDVVGDLVDMLIKATLQSMLLGQGPLAGVFGTKSAGGGIGGLLGSLFSGFFAKGGLIPNGTFGIVGERGPEPVLGTSRGPMVLPNSSLRGMGGGGDRGDIHVTINGSQLSQAELTQAVSDGIESYDRHRLPGRVAEINADPLARG